MFLTVDQIKELTGYRRPCDQRAHLERLDIPFHPDRLGRPKVLYTTLLGPAHAARAGAPAMPNLKALEELIHAKAQKK